MQAHFTDTFRESLTSVLGAPPDPAPLQPEILDIQAGKGYRREHVKYQVSPSDFSYAYLLIPDGLTVPAPVIYVHHRHENAFKVGKSEVVGLAGAKDQAIGLDLVRRGYVVFAPDSIGFGERRSPKSQSDSDDLAYSFHQLALRVLRGETLLKKVIWDVSKGIDYLETRNEVDPRYIGFVGVGFGGRMALWSAALEPRIKAAIAHEGLNTLREQIKRGDWLPAEFIVPRLLQVADVHHLLSLVVPRAFLMSVSGDEARIQDVNEAYLKVLPLYHNLAVDNRLGMYSYPDSNPSIFDRRMRIDAYNWLDTWLKAF
jgi:dienelactone hydrolase